MTETVDHPAHYQSEAGIEAIGVMEQYGLGLHLGSAMKYLLRASRKGDRVTDLRKAAWYVRRWTEGIGERNGVEFTNASDDTEGGLCWRDPNQIADAFGLEGAQREAVTEILEAAAFEPSGRAEKARIERALSSIGAAIAEAEATEA